MKRPLSLILFFLFSAGQSSGKDISRDFEIVRFSATKPDFSKGIWAFDLQSDKCNPKTYGDGRGESPCLGGRRSIQIRAPKHVKPGQKAVYSFEIFIPSDFRYDGDPRYPAFSRLFVTEWKRLKGAKNHLYEMALESHRGATFERKVCFSPKEFGKWNTFQLSINWSGKNDGYLEARCNGRVILSRINTQTLIPPDCAAEYKLQCDPARQNTKPDIMWVIGPNLYGYGKNYRELSHSPPSAFPPFPPNGVKIMVRNIQVKRTRR
ncbi:hypothetical protein [uncultured Ruegeria sp.]|uniref:hypothetical protein n=1 Tax=uncultured Ruegeria sp. TaxID=259304 RepID=UPI0026153963|nr:hypothetical protein [uncultured Ruegeria sp.]